ncbi:MAG: GTPase domain-containing protein [Thermodesulfovibrionales bacterium]|nr:GTPase domain-containing protein [Thermodesulfovibrionales bacterium]
MALFNYATKEITIKIVYYGPGLSGKTTNLQYLHSVFDPAKRGKLLSLATEADRTLFFDFLPVELGKISDFSIRFQLYTVPGQVRYNATRRLVLKGADAVIFVADSQREMKEQNIESFINMRENLTANNINPDDIPIILQYNKRDLSNVLSIDELNRDLNQDNTYDIKDAIAIDGAGVEETFQHITRLVIQNISRRHKITIQPKEDAAVPPKEAIASFSPSGEFATQTPLVEPTSHAAQDTREAVEAAFDISIRDQESEPNAKEDFTAIQERFLKEKPLIPETKDEPFIPREVVVKEIVEVPLILVEKLDKMINGLQGVSQSLKELSGTFSGMNVEMKDMRSEIAGPASNILAEIKELRKDQKASTDILRDIRTSLENIKEKKSWFRFS